MANELDELTGPVNEELLKRNVDKDHIKAVSLGGIQENTPDAASRRTRILLYYKK